MFQLSVTFQRVCWNVPPATHPHLPPSHVLPSHKCSGFAPSLLTLLLRHAAIQRRGFLPLPSTDLPQSKTAETLRLFPWEHDWLVIFVSEMESLVGFVLLAGSLISDQRMSRRKSSEAKTQHKPQALFSLIGLASAGKHITANSYAVRV